MAEALRVVCLLGTAGGTWGGMERHTLDLVRTLAESPAVEMHLVADEGYRRHVPGGVVFHALDLSRSRRSPVLWWQWRQLLKALQPQVVHAQGAKAAALLAAQSSWLRRSGCVTIGTVHGTKSGHKAYASLDAVIAVSAGIAAQLRHPSVHVIANGVAPRVPDPHIVADCRQQRAAWSGALVLAIGRLAPVKGFDLLLQAWPSNADAHLLILGDGPEHGALQQQIALLGLSDRVTLGGHSSAVTEWLHVADAMVISSHREGFPYVLVEALQAGCPVLSTGVSGVNEIVPPAYLVAPGERSLLLALLQRFIPQLGLLRQEQAPLFARALDELTLVAMAGKTLNLYLALRGHTHE